MDTVVRLTLVLVILYVFLWPFVTWWLVFPARESLARRLAGALVYYVCTYLVARALHGHLQVNQKIDYAVLWTLYAQQGIKLLHAVKYPADFQMHYRLETLSRTILFAVSPSTLVFRSKRVIQHRSNPTRYGTTAIESWYSYLIRGFPQLIAMMLLASILYSMPRFESTSFRLIIEPILCFQLLSLSYGIFDIVFNAPVRYVSSQLESFVPCVDVPAMAISPSDFWRRWSKSAGYHLKLALYTSPTILCALQTFAVNAALHILWCGPLMTGRSLEWEYAILLGVGPIVLLTMERSIAIFRANKVLRFILLYCGVVVLTPFLLSASAFPSNSHDLAALFLRW